MNVHISYKVQRTPDIEKEINHRLEKLQKRLQVFRPELIHLKGSIDPSPGKDGIAVSLNLRLPSGQMAAQRSATTATSAVKACFDDLVQQLGKHKDLLRSSHKWPRWRRGQETRPERQVPFEETIAAVQPSVASPDDVRSYVNANLRRLENFVEREIYFRETEDQLAPDTVNKEEVVDEVIVRALGNGLEKPDRLALEPWLYRLALRALDELCRDGKQSDSDVPLAQSARRPNVRASDEPELQFHQPDEMLTSESVIADRRALTPEDIAYSDEMVALVQLALKGAKPEDREAFILYAVEGFSFEEIGAITDRSIEGIHSSVAAAREQLRKSPPIANRLKDKLLEATRTA